MARTATVNGVDAESDAAAEKGAKKLSLGSGSITAEFNDAVTAYLAENPSMDKAGLVRTGVAQFIGFGGQTAPANKRGGVSTGRKMRSVQTKSVKVLDQIRAMLGDEAAARIRASMIESGVALEDS